MLYKLLSNISYHLVVCKIITAPPKFLFHKPKQQLDCSLERYILADINFNIKERGLILEAVSDLENFCNGLIKINIIFDLDPNSQQSIEDNSIILRVDGYHPAISASDQNINSKTLGLCQCMTSGYNRLYLVSERLQNDITFRTTTIHELGHFIGLDHTDKHSIMHKSNFSDILYPTYIDAEEMAKVWNIDVNCLRYFKTT